MKQIYTFLKANFKRIVIVLLFLISSAIILYFFPREGKFPYEYLKGSPWMHKDLISNYDFPLLKTDIELSAEEDSILLDFAPYFTIDQLIVEPQINAFKKDFDQKWKEFVRSSLGSNPINEVNPEQLRNIDQSGNSYFNKIKSILEFIYDRGIIEFPENEEYIQTDLMRIVVVRDMLGEDKDIDEIFTSRSAYTYLIRNIESDTSLNKSVLNQEFDFETEIDYNNYLHPNLFFDKERTEMVKTSLIENISSTKGLIQKGIRIISKGEIVNAEKFLILESLRHEYDSQLGESSSFLLIGLGHAILVLIALGMLYLYLLTFRKEVIDSIKDTGFILGFVVLWVIIAIFVVQSDFFNIYLVPFTILPLIIKTFFDARIALFSYLITIILTGFLVPNGYEFIFLQFVAGMFSIFGLYKLYRRSQLVLTALMIILSYSVSYFAISVMQEGSLSTINWNIFLWFAGNGLLFLLSYPLIYIFEKIFGFLSDVSLMELSDSNHPILRKVAEEAPGTFQHCLQVASLAEEVTREIGGNTLMVRVGALYHDIGKVENPGYFVENQVEGINPHEGLEYQKSAEIIISHVNRGIEMAKKNNLPKPVIDFIPTHHGKGKVQYFHTLYLKEKDADLDTEIFDYPGPNPFSKETAVLMMADSIEAASRSLKKFDEPSLKKLVDSIIDYQFSEGQFRNTNLTFRDIEVARKVFLEKLLSIYHARIQYPK